MKTRIIVLFSVLAAAFISVCAQTLDEAKIWFQEGRYADALPVFRAEYEINPNNPSLNLWIGISEYKTGNEFGAEKYLQFASKKNQVDACLYLGDLYAKTYRMKEAEDEYAKYERAKRRDKDALAVLEPRREYAERLSSLLRKVEDVQIIDSVVVEKKAFLSAYKLSAASGSLLPKNEFFDTQNEDDNVLYINELKDKIYYGQGDPASGLDLYTMEKLLGNFGNEKRLPASVNTSGDEAYPFVMPDGLTLYFASTGNGSIGGYDLFVTRYNLSADSYLNPSWQNMPFNSPFNDYMMAIDEDRGIGWFASDRYQPEGKVCVYTFIPSRSVVLLDNNDEQYLAKRARIASIRDSWREGVDYSPLLADLQSSDSSPAQESKGDFSFVINDEHSYHSLSDFNSDKARNLFSQAEEKEKRLSSMKQELAEKREQFANSGGNNSALRTSILQLEQETESLWKETEQLKIQSRNEEIRSNTH
ncbi:MAG: tetratricopeptide repeat protein [Dysgonamonadaceae bacterium]|jgi:tetratricopeptide (TPR) repeat protein|nr:tetratricopeptide repeat protein [Dysgonamonadaceae bacterium]